MTGPQGWANEPNAEFEPDAVRPYTLTGGRTRSGSMDLPLETLIECVVPGNQGSTNEQRILLEQAAVGFQSIAELSAHSGLPLGVVRVLVGDLVTAGLVRVHHRNDAHAAASTPYSVLESVLDGICAL